MLAETFSLLLMASAHAFNCPSIEDIKKIYQNIPPDTSHARQKKIEAQRKLYLFSTKADKDGPSFNFKVRKVPAAQTPSRGTVIFICGGPEPCAQDTVSNIPPDMNLLIYDHPGQGENQGQGLTPKQLSVEFEAKMVKLIVEKMKLQNYVIYGQSFGTAVATQATAIISNESKMTQPKGLIVEGVLGGKNLDLPDGYARTAAAAWSQLSQAEKDEFKQVYKKITEGFTPDQLVQFNKRFPPKLLLGPKVAADDLRSLTSNWREIRKNWQESFSLYRINNDVERDAYLVKYLSAGCEAMQQKKFGPEKYYEIVKNPTNDWDKVCGCRTTDLDYDSKNFQITSIPVILINGEFDPATPLEGAEYFAANQQSTKTYLLKIKGGGHFSTSDQLSPCVSDIYGSLFSSDFSSLKPGIDGYYNCSQSPPRINKAEATQ